MAEMTPLPAAPDATPDGGAAPRRPWLDLRTRWRAGAVLAAWAALWALLAVLRPLAHPPGGWAGPRVRLIYVLGLGLGVAAAALLAALKGRGRAAQGAFYAFLVLALDALGQIAGAHGWPAWPVLAMLVAAVAVAEPPGLALGIAGLAAGLSLADGWPPATGRWRAAVVAAAGYPLLALCVHQALRGEKRRLAGLLAELARAQFGLGPHDTAAEAGGARSGPAARALGRLSSAARRAREADRAHELEATLQLVVRAARRALKAHSVAYFDLDYQRQLAHLRAADGPGLRTACSLQFGQDPLAVVIDRRRSFYFTDFKRLLWALPYYERETRVGTLVAQPVGSPSAPQLQGVLLADALELQAFTGGEAELLADLAELVAALGQRLRAAFAREEQGLEFSAVIEASQPLRTAYNEARVRSALLAAAQHLAPLEAAAVVATDGERYTLEASLGWATAYEGREVALSERTWTAWLLRSATRSTLVSDLARERRPMPVLVLDEGGGRAGALAGFPLRVPLREREELLGALVLLGPAGAFDAGTQRVLDLLAGQAAVALFAARLLRGEQQRALEDGLTGLANRRAFDDQLARLLAQQDRKGGSLGVVLFDIDHFKRLNDTYGHLAGDAALKALARTVRGLLRGGDLAARYGGEEFVVLLPDADEAGALRLAERVRVAVERASLVFEGALLRYTASFGVALGPRDGATPAALLATADRALYAAKQAGRNRVALASAVPAAVESAPAASGAGGAPGGA